MSAEDGYVTGESYTILTTKQQLKQFFNIFNIEGQTVDDHLQFCNLMLDSLGLNFLKKNHKFHSILCMFNILYLLNFILSGFLFMVNNNKDMGKVTECFTTFSFGGAILIKIIILRYYRVNIRDLISRMRYDYKEAVKTEGPEKDIMMAKFLEGRILTRTFYYCSILCVILFASVPLLNYKEHKLPLTMKLFSILSEDTTLNYVLNFASHFYSMVYSIQFFVGYEAICFYSILVLCAKLDILKHRIKQIGQHEEFYKYSDFSTGEPNDLILMDKEYTEMYINKCIQTHQSIYKFAKDWNEVYHFDCFVELLFSGMIGCVSLYQVTEKPLKDAIPFYVYLFLCMIQVFVLCWYGNIVYQKSLAISIALYSTQWYRISPALRKTYHIMLIRSQKPINVSAIFTNLTLEVFTDVIRTMYSFYALLVKTE